MRCINKLKDDPERSKHGQRPVYPNSQRQTNFVFQAVAFQFSVVGDDRSAIHFVKKLSNNSTIGDYVDYLSCMLARF